MTECCWFQEPPSPSSSIDAPSFPSGADNISARQRPSSFLSRKGGYKLEGASPEVSKSMEQGKMNFTLDLEIGSRGGVGWGWWELEEAREQGNQMFCPLISFFDADRASNLIR